MNNCCNHDNLFNDNIIRPMPPKPRYVYCMGPTGPTGSTSGLNTYMMATANTTETFASSAPLTFNASTPSSNIVYNNGTFTLTNAGQYLINWAAVIKNEGPTQILSIGLYNLLPAATYINYSNTGNTISSNTSTFISGTAIVTATAGSTYQLRNASTNSISTVPNSQISTTITITRIN